MKQLGLIGCAHIHTPGILKMMRARNDVRIKSVWDHDAGRAKKTAEELGAGAVADFKAIYADADIAGVVVLTETNLHEQVVPPGAAAGKALFVEKPLGTGKRDANLIAEAIERAGVLFQTGYHSRGDSKYIFLKQQIERGNFGRITRIRASNCHGGAISRWFDTEWRWMADPKVAGVGAFGDLGTHSLDILIWLMGDVGAVTAQLDEGTRTYPGCDETGEGLLRFKNGVIGTLAAAWDDVANPVPLLISGTEGHAAIIDQKLHFVSKKSPGFNGTQPLRDAELPAAKSSGIAGFLDALVGKSGIELVSVREAAYRCAVMEAMYQGARERKWIEIHA
jgi:predicted dehydrogenase